MTKEPTREMKVREFSDRIGRPYNTLSTSELDTQCNLIIEEAKEVVSAVGGLLCTKDRGQHIGSAKEHLLKELCDLQYVLSGMVVLLGMDKNFDAAFNRVHQSNMTKTLEPMVFKDGKLMKGPNYKQADMNGLV